MPPCKNNPKRSYKGTEPSPKGLGYCASGEKVGTIKKRKHKKKWIIKEIKNKVKRWVTLNKKISDNLAHFSLQTSHDYSAWRFEIS